MLFMNSFDSQNPHQYSPVGYDPADLPSIRIGFGKRFAAWLVDGLIVGFAVVALFFVAGEQQLEFFAGLDGTSEELLLSDRETEDDSDEAQDRFAEQLGVTTGTLGVLTGMNSVFMLLYSFLELFTSASVGKRLVGISIAQSNGLAATRRTLALRWAAKYGAYILAVLPWVSRFSSIWSLVIFLGGFAVFAASRQALHDFASDAAVFNTSDVLANQ
jgi:hypothetical protein